MSKSKCKPPKNLKEGEDYIVENGKYVFTKDYLMMRGVCCGLKCRNCPYNHRNVRL